MLKNNVAKFGVVGGILVFLGEKIRRIVDARDVVG